MKKIEKLDFPKLRNAEHPRVYNRLITITQKHNPETLHLTGPFARAKAHLPELDKIEAQERGSVHTKKMEEIDQRNDNLIKGMISMAKAHILADFPATYESALLVNNWLDKHKAGSIPDDNYTSSVERISDMVADAERTPELMAALQTINVTEIFTELKTNAPQLETLFMQRKEDKSKAETVDTKAIRREADKDMRRLFTFIELYQVEYPDVDYAPLTRELNVLLAYYKTQLAARAARRAKGENVEQEPPIEEPQE